MSFEPLEDEDLKNIEPSKLKKDSTSKKWAWTAKISTKKTI